MPRDYYPDDTTMDAEPSSSGKPEPESEYQEKEEVEGATSLANSEAFPEGVKSGDVFEIEIVATYDGEVEFKVKEREEEEEVEEPEGSMGEAMSKLSDLEED